MQESAGGGESRGARELLGSRTFKAIISDTINIREMHNKNCHVMVNRRVRERFTAGEENRFFCSKKAEGCCHKFGKGQVEGKASNMHAGDGLAGIVK